MPKKRLFCTYLKACHCKWCVNVIGLSMSQAAVALELNVGTVSHVIHGRRFPHATPVPMD